MGEVINDDSLLDIVLEGLTDDYIQIKHNAETDDSWCGPSRKQKGRESTMVITFSKKGKCHICNKTGHWARDCYHRKSSMRDTNKASKKWCSLHRTHLHGNSECRSQQQQLSGNNRNYRKNWNGQRNGQHQAIATMLVSPKQSCQDTRTESTIWWFRSFIIISQQR